MKFKDFDKIVNNELAYVQKLLTSKKAEYNLTDDRFDSFKHGAEITGWTPEQVLLGYWTKHLASIIEMVNSKEVFDDARWQEKLTDSINYNLLLLGLVKDTGRSKTQEED